jgi:hypothetical protein
VRGISHEVIAIHVPATKVRKRGGDMRKTRPEREKLTGIVKKLDTEILA